jgi:hypothetical protein
MTHYDKYNARYNNQTYQAVRESLMKDLQVDNNNLTVSDIMNALTDAALQIAGAHTDDKLVVLIRVCHSYAVRPETIRLMSQHLENFEESGDIKSADFENSALVLYHLRELRPLLAPAVSVSSALHGWRGRMVHYLIMSAKLMLDAVRELLQDSNERYIAEKLGMAMTYASNALEEGAANSPSKLN